MAESDFPAWPDDAVPAHGAWGELRLLGIDIGGTSSRARLWAAGRLAAESQGQSASLPAVGPDSARAVLAALLADACVQQAVPLDAICVGAAGLSVPGTRQFLHAQLAPLTRSGVVVIVSDVMLVLPAAGIAAGIAVICGTGSVAVATFGDRTVQVGGWGYLLGDEGGGYWIVREALRVLLRRRDRGSTLGDLGDQLLAATGCDDLSMLHRRYYELPHRPGDWARYAGQVLGSADSAAEQIAARAADALAALARAAAKKLIPARNLPVVLAGGLFGNADFGLAACRAITQALPRAEVRVLTDEPVAGAVQLAGLAATQPAGQAGGASSSRRDGEL